jgi:hypothetical protein
MAEIKYFKVKKDVSKKDSSANNQPLSQPTPSPSIPPKQLENQRLQAHSPQEKKTILQVKALGTASKDAPKLTMNQLPRTTPEKSQTTTESEKQTITSSVKKTEGSSSPLDSKVRSLIEIISQDTNHAIYPYLNYETNKITFPLLSKVGESEDNVALLEKLASENVGVLEKHIFERLVLCPEHSDGFAISLRLYCGKCGSLDVERLHLIEHKACGYIGSKSEFEIVTPTKCPSCRVVIKDPGKELRIPGMWYECNGCKSKFDNPTIKLHCRKYNHDFNMNQADTMVIPYFKLRAHATTAQVNILSVIPMVKKVLSTKDFAVEETPQIKGKSGVMHTASLYAYNRDNKTIVVDVLSAANKEIDDSEVIATFVKVIDTSPTFAIFIAIPGISERARAMSVAYGNIHIVTGSNFAEIIKSVEQIMTKQLQEKTVTVGSSSGEPAVSSSIQQTGLPRRIE